MPAGANVSIVHGAPDDPHLPAGGPDAMLIVNTYHELQNPRAILLQLSRIWFRAAGLSWWIADCRRVHHPLRKLSLRTI